jgi:hypothetical protein
VKGNVALAHIDRAYEMGIAIQERFVEWFAVLGDFDASLHHFKACGFESNYIIFGMYVHRPRG